MFYWTVGTGVLVLVIGVLSLTRFLSLGCKFIKIEALCQEAGLIATLVVSIFIYSGSKLMVLYCVVMMRREIDHQVDVIDDSSHPRHGSLSSSAHVIDPTRTYGSTDSLQASVSGNASTAVPLDDFDDDVKGASSVLGPRLYMNEAQREMYEVGLKKFNAKPKRGIEFILQKDFMELLLSVRAKMSQKLSNMTSSTEIKVGAGGETPTSTLGPESADAVAIMLSDNKVISPIKLGSYLGQSDDTATAIRTAWVARMKFDQMDFDKALRLYLTKLILPPETEKIDRLMESFARHYHECNPLTFSNSDTAYVLAFGLLMLHTDAHNPNMKKDAKMTKDQFIRNMRGIDNGKDLPQSQLSGLYDRIVAEEIMTDVARKGYATIM
jgi:brefeldin A-inhibited guanine nucleotide-exchange protein